METAVLKRILESGDCCEDLLRQAGIFIRCRDDMPAGVPALTMYDGENYNVYINAKMTRERNLVSIIHEILAHIANDDWNCGLSLEEIESKAKKRAGQF